VLELSSVIAGRRVDGGTEAEDISPANPAQTVARVRLADAAAARRAVDAACAAFGQWRATPAPERGAILHRAANLVDKRAETIGRDLTREEGKTLAEGIGETRRAAAILRYFAGQTLEADGETYPSHSAMTFLYARREPLGVVTAITPWNFPIAIPAWKIAPALAYGNTVCWKPAEIVPLTAWHFFEALRDGGLPDGVLNLVFGRGSEIGDALVESPGVDAITFTGSNVVGRSVQLKAIAKGKKVQLELGGKNPAVVLADADLVLAAEQVARGAFLSAGQKCTATSRVVVEQPVLDEFTDLLVERAASWSVGDPLNEATRVGPLASESQLRTVEGYLATARADGGTLLAGGAAADLGSGYFVRPTVIADLPPNSAVVREEIFGPVAALLPADSFEEALALANDTPYGLTAAVFTRDLRNALGFAREARAGVVKVNQESAGLEFHVPFGGMKDSSSGSREQGKAAREFFTQWKTVYVDA